MTTHERHQSITAAVTLHATSQTLLTSFVQTSMYAQLSDMREIHTLMLLHFTQYLMLTSQGFLPRSPSALQFLVRILKISRMAVSPNRYHKRARGQWSVSDLAAGRLQVLPEDVIDVADSTAPPEANAGAVTSGVLRCSTGFTITANNVEFPGTPPVFLNVPDDSGTCADEVGGLRLVPYEWRPHIDVVPYCEGRLVPFLPQIP